MSDPVDPVPVYVPRENVNDETVKLVAWRVASGEKVSAGQVIAEMESSKTTFDIEAPTAGFISYSAQQGVEITVGGMLCFIGLSSAPPPQGAAAPAPIIRHAASNDSATVCVAKSAAPHQLQRVEAPEPTGLRFSGKAQELIRSRGLDAAQFRFRGLIREQDVLTALGEGPTGAPVAPSTVATESAPAVNGNLPLPAAGVPFTSRELPRSKRVEARYLSAAQRHSMASVVTMACRTRGLRAAAAADPQKMNLTSIIVYECARLLRKYPIFNAFHAQGTANLYEQVNIGFAVDAGLGLKVPVIRDADQKDIAQIAHEMQELVVQYLNEQIPVEALGGGTFTITDLSSDGVFSFHPLLNQGQSAILGVGAEILPPAGGEGMFNLILAFDHFLSEGRAAANFLGDLKNRLRGYEGALQSRSDGEEELYCSQCLKPISEVMAMEYHMLQMVLPDGKTQLICFQCLAGQW